MYKYKKTENIIFKSFVYISLITYFILRVYNFTDMLIYFYINNIMISFYSMIPILMMNYWFYFTKKINKLILNINFNSFFILFLYKLVFISFILTIIYTIFFYSIFNDHI